MRAFGTESCRLPTRELQAEKRDTLHGTFSETTDSPRDSSNTGSPSKAGAVAGTVDTVYSGEDRHYSCRELMAIVTMTGKEPRGWSSTSGSCS